MKLHAHNVTIVYMQQMNVPCMNAAMYVAGYIEYNSYILCAHPDTYTHRHMLKHTNVKRIKIGSSSPFAAKKKD